MRVLVSVLFAIALTASLTAQNGLGTEKFDPTIDVDSLVRSSPGTPKHPLEQPLPPDLYPDPDQNPFQITFSEQLPGYKESKSDHPKILDFASEVSSRIESLITSGQRIDGILVTGFADGLPNRGINRQSVSLPSVCEHGVDGTVSDPELAYLRGCIVWNELVNFLGLRHPALISTFARDKYDEPDGGLTGDPHRKVVIKVSYKEDQRHHEE